MLEDDEADECESDESGKVVLATEVVMVVVMVRVVPGVPVTAGRAASGAPLTNDWTAGSDGWRTRGSGTAIGECCCLSSPRSPAQP